MSRKEIYVKVECVQCGATRNVGLEESKRLSSWGGEPMCDKCYGPCLAISATNKKSNK